jgi:hypothetical protein
MEHATELAALTTPCESRRGRFKATAIANGCSRRPLDLGAQRGLVEEFAPLARRGSRRSRK